MPRLRARLVERPSRDRWSSAAVHCGGGSGGSWWLNLKSWRAWLAGRDWRETLSNMLDRETPSTVRLNPHRGRPVGSDSFLGKLETLLGRRLRPLLVGRPR